MKFTYIQTSSNNSRKLLQFKTWITRDTTYNFTAFFINPANISQTSFFSQTKDAFINTISASPSDNLQNQKNNFNSNASQHSSRPTSRTPISQLSHKSNNQPSTQSNNHSRQQSRRSSIEQTVIKSADFSKTPSLSENRPTSRDPQSRPDSSQNRPDSRLSAKTQDSNNSSQNSTACPLCQQSYLAPQSGQICKFCSRKYCSRCAYTVPIIVLPKLKTYGSKSYQTDANNNSLSRFVMSFEEFLQKFKWMAFVYGVNKP